MNLSSLIGFVIGTYPLRRKKTKEKGEKIKDTGIFENLPIGICKLGLVLA